MSQIRRGSLLLLLFVVCVSCAPYSWVPEGTRVVRFTVPACT